MKNRNLSLFALAILFIVVGCKETEKVKMDGVVNQEMDFEKEEKAILERLNNETKDAFQRDYEAWTENWVHDPNISKMYMNFVDSTYSESIGWDEISQFVKHSLKNIPNLNPYQNC